MGCDDDTDAFSSMWKREVATIHRYCLKLLGNAADADDAVSRVAIRALRHFDPQLIADQGAWLRRVARNVCVDIQRERLRNRMYPLDTLETAADADRQLIVHVPTPESLYLERERWHSLQQAVDALPPSLSRLIELHVTQELRFTEIAKHTGMSESNVRRRIGEAYDRMRSMLHHPLPEKPRDAELRASSDDAFGASIPSRIEALRETWIDLGTHQREITLALSYVPSRFSRRTMSGLHRYIDSHPRGWRKRLTLARVLRERGELATAVRLWRDVLRARPGHVAAWVELAESIAELEGPAAAAAICDDAEHSVRSEAAPLMAGLEASYRGDVNEALSWLEPLTLAPDQQTYVWFLIARICTASGRLERAADALDRALYNDPTKAALLLSSCDVLERLGRDDDARARLALAFQLDALNPLTLQRFLIDSARAAMPRRDTALLARRLGGLAPDATTTIRALAELAFARGAAARAIAITAAFTRRRPRAAAAWRLHAEFLSRSGAPATAAADALEQAAALS